MYWYIKIFLWHHDISCVINRAYPVVAMKFMHTPDPSRNQSFKKIRARDCESSYPLVNKHIYWKWPFLVDLPMKIFDFPWFLVCLPEGNIAIFGGETHFTKKIARWPWSLLRREEGSSGRVSLHRPEAGCDRSVDLSNRAGSTLGSLLDCFFDKNNKSSSSLRFMMGIPWMISSMKSPSIGMIFHDLPNQPLVYLYLGWCLNMFKQWSPRQTGCFSWDAGWMALVEPLSFEDFSGKNSWWSKQSLTIIK